jgi:hypothetical protein
MDINIEQSRRSFIELSYLHERAFHHHEREDVTDQEIEFINYGHMPAQVENQFQHSNNCKGIIGYSPSGFYNTISEEK